MFLPSEPMKEKPLFRNYFLPFVILLGSLLSTALLFYLTFQWDNKYTAKDQPSLHVLADNWEFYSDSSSEPQILTIGQYSNFSSLNPDRSPFGNGVYRKTLFLEPSSDGWLLEMPEIFSASNIYINGEQVREYGSIEKEQYQIHIQNTLLSLPPGDVEIVVQVSNYSHYYSGMVYPPLLGKTSTITFLVISRIIFYSLLCFFTLGCSVVSFRVWLRTKADPLYTTFGILCFCFALHISYPLIHWLGINAGVLPYVLEDTAWYAVVCCMSILTYRLAGVPKYRRLYSCFYGVSVCMLLFPLTAFYFLFPAFSSFINIYSTIVSISKVLMSLFLIAAAFAGTRHRPLHIWLLSGNAIFGLGYLLDYLTGGRFEPLRFGWQTEYCGFLMVVLFTILFVKYNHQVILEKEYLTEHLQEEVQRKTAWLTSLMEERKQFLSSVAHDLKAPAAVINTYIDYIRNNTVNSDEEIKHYLEIIDHKSAQIRHDIENLQMFHSDSIQAAPAEQINCNEFLQSVYSETRAYTDACGIHFCLNLPEQSCFIYGQRHSLHRVFENLIINATEHTPIEGSLIISAACTSAVDIMIMDNGEGIPASHLDQIFQYGYSTKESKGLRGLGLYYCKTSIEELGGSISVQSTPGVATTFHIRLPLSVPFRT